MYALGLVETRGLIGAVEAADVMLKAADTRLLEKVHVGGGLVTITVLGDVAAVQAAVDAAQAAIMKLGEGIFVTKNVIPRPLDEVIELFNPICPKGENNEGSGKDKKVQATKEPKDVAFEAKTDNKVKVKTTGTLSNKKELDLHIQQNGLKATMGILSGLKVVNLRALARDIDDFGINGRELAKANKEQLMNEFQNYYK